MVRRTIFGGVPITLARLVHPGSRYQLQGRIPSHDWSSWPAPTWAPG
jgi:hypothetical protein